MVIKYFNGRESGFLPTFVATVGRGGEGNFKKENESDLTLIRIPEILKRTSLNDLKITFRIRIVDA